MVQVYAEPYAKRHYASFFSAAFAYRVFVPCLAVIVSFVIALSTGDMWIKNNVYLEQPDVRFGYDLVLVLETSQPGQERVWTTFAGVNSALGDMLLAADVQAAEQDINKDGHTDVIDVRVTSRGLRNYEVHSVKLVMTFNYQLNHRISLDMKTLAFVQHASPLAGAALHADGELMLRQRNAILDGTLRATYTSDIINWARHVSDVRSASDLHLEGLISSYLDRNETTYLDVRHPVWVAGQGDTFTVNARVRIPTHQQILFRPGGFEVAKFGWIQFLSILAIFVPVVYWVDWVFFHFRVFTTRVVHDLQPKVHRF